MSSQANGATYQTGTDITLRLGFVNDGKLNNTADTRYRAINQCVTMLSLQRASPPYLK